MGTDSNAATQGEQGQDTPTEPLTEDRVVALIKSVVGNTVNAAMTNHLKRTKPQEDQAAQIQKQIDEAVAKALGQAQGQPPQGNGTATDPAKPSPEVVRMQEQFEKLERKYADAEARAKAVEDKARRESTHSAIKDALNAKGISGAKALAVIAYLEQSGAVRHDEDGVPRLAVKRSRTKNAPPEEIEWDLAQGIDDWSKGPDAAEFLPPPTVPIQGRPGYGGPITGSRRGPIAYDKPAHSEEEALRRAEEQLVNQGVDITAAFRR